jgi:hypothetical protein
MERRGEAGQRAMRPVAGKYNGPVRQVRADLGAKLSRARSGQRCVALLLSHPMFADTKRQV